MNTRLKANSLKALFASLLLGVSSSALAIELNEIRIDQPGGDDDEYFELYGQPNESLDGLSYIVIGDGTGGSGVVEAVVDLNAQSLTSAGLFVAAEDTFTLGSANLTTGLDFENSDNVTHMLVTGFTGNKGDDLDTNDDGEFDLTPWTAIVDSVSLVETPDSGEQYYSDNTVGPDRQYVPGHIAKFGATWSILTFDDLGQDTPGCTNDGLTCSPTDEEPPVEEVVTPIYEIQGAGDASSLVGQTVTTEGVVTSYQQDGLRGYFIQSLVGDDNPATSDGIYVFDRNNQAGSLQVGDLIRITAEVDEYFNLTELKFPSKVEVLSQDNVIEPTVVSMPETTNGEIEQYEGMLIKLEGDLVVAQNYFLGRYGQLTLASKDDNGELTRLVKSTDAFATGTPEELALADENARRLIVLDDNSTRQNTDPVAYEHTDGEVVRGGDLVSNLVGVLHYGRISSGSLSDYILQPTETPVFTKENLRSEAPKVVDGRLKVAAFNVLNYFTTLDNGQDVCGPLQDQSCRGADSSEEFERQKVKIVKAIAALDADVVGLIEIENNGSGEASALQDLVDGVNAYLGYARYTAVQPETDTLGNDVIAVALIYDAEKVSLEGAAQTLTTGAFSPDLTDGLSRQPILQTFRETLTGETFSVMVNHLKSKRPPSEFLGDGNDDLGDGQGAWNERRTEAAQDLSAWVESLGLERTLIIGDLNAYAQEDPILTLENAGYVNAAAMFDSNTYSYTFDGAVGSLDYALSSEGVYPYVTGATVWHINTDEAALLDYNTEYKGDVAYDYYRDDVFRASDHDPVILGLTLPDVDRDQDGVLNEDDRCVDTPYNTDVNEYGCSSEQVQALIDELIAPYADAPHGIRKLAVKYAIVHLYYSGYITYWEAKKLYWAAQRTPASQF